jgi:citrate lyase subunit beta/citryl-CoA lyase
MYTPIRPLRSVLYMPGSNARALEKAKSLDADALIFDLEDAVAPDVKEMARDQVCQAVRQGGFGDRRLIIRVNHPDTPWGRADMEAACGAGPHAILAPKISRPEDVERAGRALVEFDAPRHTDLWAMMETPLAMLNAEAIAARGALFRLKCLVMGTNDLARETRAKLVSGRVPMLPWLMACLAAARAHGLDIIDGVYNDLDNLSGLDEECRQGGDLGMDGKTLIHPRQIASCNRVFTPSAAEISWAQTVLAAFELPENAEKGVIRVDGRMVERLHAEMARRTVAIAEAVAARA